MRKTILSRFALIYFLLFLFVVVVIGKIFVIQNLQKSRWQKIGQNMKRNKVEVAPIRGNICDEDGSVLATSVPGYFVSIDLYSEGVQKVFAKESDSLAFYLANFYEGTSKNYCKRKLQAAYNGHDRGFKLTPEKIDYMQLQEMKQFPILRRGRFGGGLIVTQENKRVAPLGMLARRTIGRLNKGVYDEITVPTGYNGLENAYENELRGRNGVGYRENISGRWITRTTVEPQNGMDVITTLNAKYQDIAESALLRQANISQPEWATAVLMEVETGEVKAIANLGKGSDGEYYEKDNYALGHRSRYEPGSTFKLVSLMVAIEDGVVDTSDVFDTGNGYWAAENIYDDHHCGAINVKQILEQSSNIGTAKVILSNYKDRPRDYVDRIYSFGIHKPLGLELEGEGVPKIKYPGNADWWGTTLGRMSYGYDLEMTPLQVLNFYNAVANDGVMVKPHFVKEIRDNGSPYTVFDVKTLNPRIASRQTIAKAQAMLKGVCQNGTGRGVQGKYFQVAGKTGTARVAKEDGAGYIPGAYYASFVGYFPADEPQYSLIVTFKRPKNSIYGAAVAGPVFKEISEKVYASRILASANIEESEEGAAPSIKKGQTEDILEVANVLEIENIEGAPTTPIASVKINENRVLLSDNQMPQDLVPNVIGMGASNAVFVMEDAGLKVKIRGVGKVKQQSLKGGTKFRRGQTVYLALN